jgi:predicted Zn finger-like uncharacterized protein
MSLVVRCPHCRAVLTITANLVDRSVRCSKCTRSFRSLGRTTQSTSPQGTTPPPSRRPSTPLAFVPPSAEYDGPPPLPPVPPPLPPPRRSRRFLYAFCAVFLIASLATGGYLAWKFYPRPAPATQPAQESERFGGIEIGSKGIKFAVIDRFKDPELGYDFNVVHEEDVNTTIVAGMENTGRFDPDALKDSVAAVKKFYDLLTEKYGVPAERIFIVGSSGLLNAVRDKEELRQANQDKLSQAVFDAVGKKPDFLDPQREAQLSIVGAVPRKYADSSLYIDIGSGNAKGGYREASGRFVTWSVPFGTVTFTDRVRKDVNDRRTVSAWVSAQEGLPAPIRHEAEGRKAIFAVRAAELRDSKILPELRRQSELKPGLVNRERAYLSGGIVWTVATLMRPADRKSYVEMQPSDFDDLIDSLSRNPSTLPLPPINGLGDEALRNAVQKDLNKIGDTFKPDQVLAAAEILRACSREFGLGQQGRKMYFVRNGKIAWLLAYIVEAQGQRNP